MASPWLLADQQRRRAAQAEELARLTEYNSAERPPLLGTSAEFGPDNPNAAPKARQGVEGERQLIKVNPVPQGTLAPGVSFGKPPVRFDAPPQLGLKHYQGSTPDADILSEFLAGGARGAGKVAEYAGYPFDVGFGVAAMPSAIIADDKDTGKSIVGSLKPPFARGADEPTVMGDLFHAAANSAGKALDPDVPALERAYNAAVPFGVAGAAIAGPGGASTKLDESIRGLGPLMQKTAGPLEELGAGTNAMARKVHQAILSRAKEAGRGETLFSLPGTLTAEQSMQIRLLESKRANAKTMEARNAINSQIAELKQGIGKDVSEEATVISAAEQDAARHDMPPEEYVADIKIGEGEEATANLTRPDPIRKRSGRVTGGSDDAQKIIMRIDQLTSEGKFKREYKNAISKAIDDLGLQEGNEVLADLRARIADYPANKGEWKIIQARKAKASAEPIAEPQGAAFIEGQSEYRPEPVLPSLSGGNPKYNEPKTQQSQNVKPVRQHKTPDVGSQISQAQDIQNRLDAITDDVLAKGGKIGDEDYIPEYQTVRPAALTVEPVPREPAISPETQAEFKAAAEQAGNPEYADKVLAKVEEMAQGPGPLADDAADQAEKTYAMVASQHRPPATQAGTQIVPQAGGPVGPHVYSTFNTRGVPPGPGAPNPQLTGPKPKGWEPAFDPDQPARNAAAGRYDVPPVGRFFEYTGINPPELVPERTAIGKTNLLEKATAGKSEYSSMPHRQRQVAAARLAKTDAAHRLQEMNNAEQVVASEILPGAIQTATDLHHNPRIERELTKATPLPGTDAYVTRWQLGTSKHKLAQLTGEEKRVLDGLNQGVEKIGDYAERFKFALQTSDGKLVPFKKSGNWPQFTKPEHWKLMRDDPNYMEAYLKALTDANARFGYDVTSQANQLRQSILETKNLAEMETAFEHARDIPVPIAAFKYDGSVREVTNFRLTGEGGYIESLTSKAPRHVAWNHYFGQNFNQVGEQAIKDFKLLNPTAPTPRSVVDDFVRIFKEGGYLKDAKSFEALVHAMHGTKPEGWMNLLAPGFVKSAAQFATQNSVSRFLSNIFRFNVSRMTDEVFKYNLVQPFAQTKALGGASRLLKPETTIDTIKAWFTGGSRGKLSNRGLEMNPFERLPIESDEIANAYMKHGSNWKTADEIMNRVAMKRFTEEKSSRAMDLSSARYMQELEEMAKGGITRGRRDTLVHSVGMPQTWIDALERTAPMPKSPERDVMMKLLADAYETQFVKRSSHINQSPLFKTGIELWDKNILTAPFSIFAREPAQYFAHTIQSARQIVDGMKKMNMSMFAEGSRRLSAQAVGLGITGGFVSFANNILQRARGLEPDEERSLIKSLTLLVAQGTMGKFADVLNPAIQQAINGKSAGDKLSAISWTSPHFQVGADYVAPVLNQLTNSDADLMHDMWKHIVTKYIPGRAITSFLGLGMAAWQATKADIQKATEKTRKAPQAKPKETAPEPKPIRTEDFVPQAASNPWRDNPAPKNPWRDGAAPVGAKKNPWRD